MMNQYFQPLTGTPGQIEYAQQFRTEWEEDCAKFLLKLRAFAGDDQSKIAILAHTCQFLARKAQESRASRWINCDSPQMMCAEAKAEIFALAN